MFHMMATVSQNPTVVVPAVGVGGCYCAYSVYKWLTPETGKQLFHLFHFVGEALETLRGAFERFSH